MEFMYMAFVAGAATFSIPVIIHLMFKMRKKRIIFSSLRFLQKSVLEKTRKLRLREILLLLLRCAACILTALAFARPYRPASAAAGASGKPQEDLVLVVDDSPSLLAQENTSVRWPALLDRARKEVAAHPPGDRVGLVFASEPSRAEIELSNNFGAVTAALTRDRPSYHRGNLAQALNTAIELLAQSQQPLRRILLYSDLQTTQIDKGAFAESAQKAAAAGRGITVQIETPSGEQPQKLPNLAVLEVRAKSDVWIDQRPAPFAVRVANYGETDNSNVVVKLVVDGKTLATRTVGLSRRSSTEIELSSALPHAGEIFGYVEIEAHDAFPEDDRRYFAVHLRDSLKALVIEESLREKDSFLDESYYVRMALDPRARGGDMNPIGITTHTDNVGAQSYIQVQAAALSKVTAEMYANCDLIVLCGITTMGEKELRLLEQAVKDGKNLILFVGRADGRISDAFYNGQFWKDGKGILPARPGKPYEGNVIEKKYHQIGEFKSDHVLFKPFAGADEPYLRMPRFVRHFEADPADLKAGAPQSSTSASGGDATSRPAGTVLASFTDSSPMVMERPFGKGSVLMFNFAPRPESTTLVQRKAFVPLLHQAVRYFAGSNVVSHRNLISGESIDFTDAGAAADVDVKLESPLKEKGALSLRGNDHPNVEAFGIYTAQFPRGNLLERAYWSSNLDPQESDLNTEDLASVRAIFTTSAEKGVGANGVPDVQWDDERKLQAPDWRYFLVAALACLLLEIVVRDFFA